MKYKRFEELPVWQASIELGVQTYGMTAKPVFRRNHRLRDQVERAAVSVSNNIAEGSAGEVRSMLCLLERIPDFLNLESEIRKLKARAESISRQLGAWIQSILNSSLKGQRYVTDKARQASSASEKRKEFLEELQRIRESGGVAKAERGECGHRGGFIRALGMN